MTPSRTAQEARTLWTPDRVEQIAAAETLLCNGMNRDARSAVKQRLSDWLAHANGCRRRAHEYKRWALEYELAGNFDRYRHYRGQSDKSWRMAKDALIHARREKDAL